MSTTQLLIASKIGIIHNHTPRPPPEQDRWTGELKGCKQCDTPKSYYRKGVLDMVYLPTYVTLRGTYVSMIYGGNRHIANTCRQQAARNTKAMNIREQPRWCSHSLFIT